MPFAGPIATSLRCWVLVADNFSDGLGEPIAVFLKQEDGQRFVELHSRLSWAQAVKLVETALY